MSTNTSLSFIENASSIPFLRSEFFVILIPTCPEDSTKALKAGYEAAKQIDEWRPS